MFTLRKVLKRRTNGRSLTDINFVFLPFITREKKNFMQFSVHFFWINKPWRMHIFNPLHFNITDPNIFIPVHLFTSSFIHSNRIKHARVLWKWLKRLNYLWIEACIYIELEKKKRTNIKEHQTFFFQKKKSISIKSTMWVSV